MVMGIIQKLTGGLGGGVGGVQPGRVSQPSQMPFKSFVGVTDGDAAFDTSAEVAALVQAQSAGGVSELIWQMTVPAQQKIRWGFGSPQFQVNQGFMWYFNLDAGTDFQEGVIRLVQANARQTKIFTVAELPTEQLHLNVATTPASATPTSRDDMLPLPEKVEFLPVGEDSLLQIWHRTTIEGTTIDRVEFSIPITIYQ